MDNGGIAFGSQWNSTALGECTPEVTALKDYLTEQSLFVRGALPTVWWKTDRNPCCQNRPASIEANSRQHLQALSRNLLMWLFSILCTTASLITFPFPLHNQPQVSFFFFSTLPLPSPPSVVIYIKNPTFLYMPLEKLSSFPKSDHFPNRL